MEAATSFKHKTSRGAIARLGVIAVASLLGACASAPPVRTPSSSLPPAYDLAQDNLPAAAIDRWWLLYHDEQLAFLTDRAMQGGFSVLEAFARLDEAHATRAAALSRYGLQGDLQADAKAQRTEVLRSGEISGLPGDVPLTNLFAPAPSRTANASLPVSWELDLFGRRRTARRAADANLAAARFNFEGTRAMLAADVAGALFETRGLAIQLTDAEAALANQRCLKNVVAGRVERGLDASTELDDIQANLAQAEARAVDIAGALKASRRALLVLIGSGTASLDSLPVTTELPTIPAIPRFIPGDLLVRRPDVREARAQLDAAAGNVRLAELAFYPTISLQAAISFVSQTSGIATTSATGTVGGGLTAPIFDRHRLHAALRTASAQAEQAVLAYERLVQTAYAEVNQALVRLDADRKRVAVLEAGLVNSQRAYDAALRRLQRGLVDLQKALDAERTLRSARSALTAARVEALTRSVAAFQSLGGGWAATPGTTNREDR